MTAPDTAVREPDWLREIGTVLCVHPQLVIAGNVRDRYLVPRPDGGGAVPLDLAQALGGVLLRRGFGTLLRYVPGLGVGVAAGAETPVARAAGGRASLSPPELADLVTAVAGNHGPPVALLVEYSSQLTGSDGSVDDGVRQLLTRARHSALTALPAGREPDGRALPYNTILWVADREHDLPTWFVTATPTIRLISVPLPAAPQRQAAASICLRPLARAANATGEQFATAVGQLTSATDGMPLRAVLGTAALAVDQGIGLERVRDAAQAYRTGVVEDPWRHPHTREQIRNGEKILSGEVLGQEPAVRKALDLLTRSVMGLNGAQAGGHGGRPRGVLFFAGPTGVGKTELAKSITRLVFGDEDAYLRFDMSEFSAEHSEARLIGAPPGYTGFDAGGELTSAVRARPFRVILFDEIDKADPAILDKFLQILEDGRLTDGRGSTVLFSDTLLIFTSNKGVLTKDGYGNTVENVTPDMDRDEVEQRLRASIREFFREEIQRPELFNRLGDGVVVFDFIRPDVAERLLELFVRRVAARVEHEHGLVLRFAEQAWWTLHRHALADLSNGGRGVATAVESMVVNPLARSLFETSVPGPEVRVERIRSEHGVWTVDVS